MSEGLDAICDWYFELKPIYHCPHKVVWTGESFDTIRRRIYDAYGVPDIFREERFRRERNGRL